MPQFHFVEEIQNFNMYNSDEVKKNKLRNMYHLHKWITKLFSEEKKIPRSLFEAGEVAGSATYKQTVRNCVVL